MTARLEALGSLLTAMAVVAMTGEMPLDHLRRENSAHCEFDIDRRVKVIVPLCRRYPFLFDKPRRGGSGYYLQHRHTVLIEEQFGLRWEGARVRELATMQVMPSTVQIELARYMADGEPELMRRLLVSRATKGIGAARDYVAHRFRVGCTITSLWRFAGNADVLWYALRDDLETFNATRSEVPA